MKKMNFGLFKKPPDSTTDQQQNGIYSSGSNGYSNSSVDSGAYAGVTSAASIDSSSTSQQQQHQSLSRLHPTTNYEDSNFQLMQQDTMRFLLEQSAREQEARILDLTATLESKDREIERLRSGLDQKDVERIQLRQQVDLLQLVQKQRDDDDNDDNDDSMKDRVTQVESELLAIKDKHSEESKQWLHHKATLVKRIAILSRTESECEEAQLKVQSLTIEMDQLRSEQQQQQLVAPSSSTLKDDNTQLMRKLADLESSFESERASWMESRALLEERLSEHQHHHHHLSSECSVLKAELQATKDELQATKAELQTTKEELQTTKDELQATKDGFAKERSLLPPLPGDDDGSDYATKKQQLDSSSIDDLKHENATLKRLLEDNFKRWLVEKQLLEARIVDGELQLLQMKQMNGTVAVVAAAAAPIDTSSSSSVPVSVHSAVSSSDYLCLQEDLENVVMRYDFVNSELKRREGELDELRDSMQANSMTTMKVEFDRIIREQNNLLSDFQDKLVESEAKKSSLNSRISILEGLKSDLEELVRSSNLDKRLLRTELDHEVASKESYLVQLKSMHADIDSKAAIVRDLKAEHAAELSRSRDELRSALNKHESLRSELSRREQELSSQAASLLLKESSMTELLRQVSELKSEVSAVSDDRHKMVAVLTASEKQLKQSLQSEIASRQSIEMELARRSSALQSDRLVLEKLRMDFDGSQIRVAELTEDLAQSKQRTRVANIELLRKNEDIAKYQSTIAQAEASDSQLRHEVSHLKEQTLRQSAEAAELSLKATLTEEGLRAELKDKLNHIIDLQSRKDSSDFQSEQNKALYLLTKSELSKANTELSFTQRRVEESEALRVKDIEAVRIAGDSALARCNSELNDCRSQLSASAEEAQQGRSTIATLISALRESKTSHDNLESSAIEEKIRLESALSELIATNTAMKERVALLESQSARSSDELQSMELDRRRLHSNLEELQALLSDNRASKEAEVLQLEDDLKRVLMKCDSLRAEVEKSEKALSDSSSLLVDRDSEVDRLILALRSAETQVQDKNNLLATDDEALKKCRAQIEQLSSDLTQSQGSIAELTNELRGSAGQVLELQAHRDSLQSEIDGLHATIRSEGVSANEEIMSLRDRLSSLSVEGLARTNALNAELEDVSKKLAESHLQLKSLQLEYKNLQSQSDANSAAALKEIQSTKDEVVALTIRMQAAATAFEKDMESSRSQIQMLSESRSLLESDNRRLQSVVDTKEEDLQQLSGQIAALQLQTAASDDRLRLLVATNDEADRDSTQLKTSLTAKQAECNELLELNDSLSSQLRGCSEQTAIAAEEVAKTRSLLNTSEEKVVEFGQSKTKLEWKIKSLTDDSRKLSLQLQIAQEDIQENRKELERCRDLLSKKTADYQSLSQELQQTNMEALARGEIAIPEYEKDDFESAPDIVYSFQMAVAASTDQHHPPSQHGIQATTTAFPTDSSSSSSADEHETKKLRHIQSLNLGTSTGIEHKPRTQHKGGRVKSLKLQIANISPDRSGGGDGDGDPIDEQQQQQHSDSQSSYSESLA